MAGVKQLSESLTFQAAIATMKAEILAENGGQVEEYFQGLPNEANGDPKPNSGLYLSGDGVVKLA